ncbi:dihydroxyacetone kinase, C-terminal domain [uncultured Alphaproteobacteria bacterium]|uniref:Dihydroxyacetone kinase, C-terminal domain n=1 Tax=uncultured Alphaproteobacteria bacterium TaxID=91750 RepID=A0A212IVB5_9PROT|nr:dihydroxyacetone kinase, C-terminal domain [uncultured Alphaproteobacteria bacterium]
MSDFTVTEATSWIKASAAALDKEAAHLSDLDAAIGDGDHGANMKRGFLAVEKKLDAAAPADLGALFKTVGMTLLSTVGGASGPLYGGFFLEIGKRGAGQSAWDAATLAEMLKAGLGDIVKRGKAQLGDKTMVDALTPALDAMTGDLAAATAAAAKAAREAATATAPLLAKKGRASYLGERSIGHQDPGANSVALLLETLADTCKG